jgi:hypothetical protein
MNHYLAEMSIGSEAGSYLRLLDFVYHSTLGVSVIKKKKKYRHEHDFLQGIAAFPLEIRPTAPTPWVGIEFIMHILRDHV